MSSHDLSKTIEYISGRKVERRKMEDVLILTVGIKGENIMGNPLLTANGLAVIKGKLRDIKVETPITSIPDFINAFEGLFREEKS